MLSVDIMAKNRTVAYLRVSTNEQDLEKNKADILYLANSYDGKGAEVGANDKGL